MDGTIRRPLSLLIKPASGRCNLNCRYCFYRAELGAREKADRGLMSVETADALIGSAVGAAKDTLHVSFQGGEPTLWGLDRFRDFSEKLIGRAKENDPKLKVSFSIQTNGVLCASDGRWAGFFAENDWLVGLSLDGNKPLHDLNRVDMSDSGSYETVRKAADSFAAAGVKYNILTVVTDALAKKPREIYNEYKNNGWDWMQFIPCISNGAESLSPRRWSRFLCVLFDCWYADIAAYLSGRSRRRVSVRRFDDLIRAAAGQTPEECGSRGWCSLQFVVEADGDVYPCDFYCLDQYRLGAISEGIPALAGSENGKSFLRDGAPALKEECRSCPALVYCRGGCRRYRGEDGGYVFCEAEKELARYAGDRIKALAGYLA